MKGFCMLMLFWTGFYFLISPLDGLGVESWIKIVAHFALLAVWAYILLVFDQEVFKIISSRYCCGWMMKIKFFRRIYYFFSPPELYFGSTSAEDLVKKFNDDSCISSVIVRYNVPFLGYPGIWGDIKERLQEYNTEVKKASSGKVEFGFKSNNNEDSFLLHYFRS